MWFDQRQCRQALGMARSAGRHRADDQAVAVLHQCVAHETQPRFFAGSFAEEPGVRVGGGSVRIIAAALAMEVALTISPRARRLARAVLRAEALRARPGFQQRAIDRKVLLDNKRLTLSCESTAARNLLATSPSNSRSRFLVKLVASHRSCSRGHLHAKASRLMSEPKSDRLSGYGERLANPTRSAT